MSFINQQNLIWFFTKRVHNSCFELHLLVKYCRSIRLCYDSILQNQGLVSTHIKVLWHFYFSSVHISDVVSSFYSFLLPKRTMNKLTSNSSFFIFISRFNYLLYTSTYTSNYWITVLLRTVHKIFFFYNFKSNITLQLQFSVVMSV